MRASGVATRSPMSLWWGHLVFLGFPKSVRPNEAWGLLE